MLLRPRQKILVDRTMEALREHGNTLAVAPTGAGKTIMMAAIIARLHAEAGVRRTISLAHRDILIHQNREKFSRVVPYLATGVFDAEHKSWEGVPGLFDAKKSDDSGVVTFAMVQTLSRDENLQTMPAPDFIVVDEGHHAATETYQRIIDRARILNPDMLLLGITATNREGKLTLADTFSQISDQVTIRELIDSGHLVRPRTFVVDVGVQDELQGVKRSGDEYDMDAASRVMNHRPVNSAVVKHWRERAGDRQTVVFCSNLAHACGVLDAYQLAGVSAVLVTGSMGKRERHRALDSFERGEAQVVINVAVLTEGWDCPPVSCVVLLRPSSQKSTMIQMVGRGLRTVCPTEYPGFVKTDCIVLDFGSASLEHGALEQKIDLAPRKGDGEPPIKECPACKEWVLLATMLCPECGHVWASKAKPAEDFTMTEVDLLTQSNFHWQDLERDGRYHIATGQKAWAGVMNEYGRWYAVGGKGQDRNVELLAVGEYLQCLAAANDWMNTNETTSQSHKKRDWLRREPTERQLRLITDRHKTFPDLTRYHAACLITMRFHHSRIWGVIDAHHQEEYDRTRARRDAGSRDDAVPSEGVSTGSAERQAAA